MSKHLISMIIISVASISVLIGCSSDNPINSNSATDEQSVESSDTATPAAPINDIDWSLVATDETPIERADYDYPFAIDSQNVQDYADYFDVDNATAQHNLTVGMVSNEPLSKILDQLGASYTSHELTDDENMTLIIHTTPNINASSYDYVFDSDYAKGLALPIEIVPNGVKSQDGADPHEEI
ncbi:hypothetical protein [uncultured Psychrobacter sp.]|uniref:hypothetical protein n=1 Tax=uncultured Psychrobacter sp. TaxID=259303 RepID=UPI003458A894